MTGFAGGAAGYILGEFNPVVRSLIGLGNVMATISTSTGLIASAESGDLGLAGSMTITPDAVNLTVNASVPGSSIASVALTAAGWFAQPVSVSLPLQVLAVMNDNGEFSLPNLSDSATITIR